MRVCFLVPGLSRSGGIDVVRRWAALLEQEYGWEVALLEPGAAREGDEEWDAAVATWWTTIPLLAGMRATRRGLLAQGFDPLHYREGEFVDRTAALVALAAPFDVIGVSEWVCEMVRALRPDAACRVVRPGVDKDLFGGAARAVGEGPLRVLVDGQPSVWFKGVSEALAAVGAMSAPAEATVVAHDPGAAGDVGRARVLGGLDGAGMAALYREADVVLKLSRFEGLGLVPVEAFHAGVPCVATPYGGHAEYLRDGENGLLAGFDDVPGTARALDRLAGDRDLLARLSEGALATAAGWPDEGASAAELRDAIEALGPGAGDAATLRVAAREASVTRGVLARLHGRVAELERALDDERADVIRLDAAYREASAQLDAAAAQLEEVKASKAYRAALRLRGLLPGR